MAKKTTRKKTSQKKSAAADAETPEVEQPDAVPEVSVGYKVLVHLNLNGAPLCCVARVAELLGDGRISVHCDHPTAPDIVRDVAPVKPHTWPGAPAGETGKIGWEVMPSEEDVEEQLTETDDGEAADDQGDAAPAADDLADDGELDDDPNDDTDPADDLI